MTGKEIVIAVLDHMQANDLRPEDAWAFSDDYESLGLDHRSPDGSKFWLDLDRDGTITILWKPAGADTPNVCKFTQQ